MGVLPDGQQALYGSDDYTLRLRDLETGAALRTLGNCFPHSCRVISLSTSGKESTSLSVCLNWC